MLNVDLKSKKFQPKMLDYTQLLDLHNLEFDMTYKQKLTFNSFLNKPRQISVLIALNLIKSLNDNYAKHKLK